MTQIASVIDQWADNTPEKIALVCAEQSYSYQQLYDDANNVAVNLQMKHYASEHVALHMPECYEYVLCYLALHKIAAVPLSITYKAKAQEMEFKLIHGEAKALVIHHSKLQELAKINLEQTQVQDIWVVGDGEHRYISFQQLLSQQKKLQQEDVDENTLAAIYYTSGSTGNPKAVMHSHKTLYQGLLNGAELLESHHNSVLVMKQPLGHMGAYLQTFSNLLHGATTILTNMH